MAVTVGDTARFLVDLIISMREDQGASYFAGRYQDRASYEKIMREYIYFKAAFRLTILQNDWFPQEKDAKKVESLLVAIAQEMEKFFQGTANYGCNLAGFLGRSFSYSQIDIYCMERGRVSHNFGQVADEFIAFVKKDSGTEEFIKTANDRSALEKVLLESFVNMQETMKIYKSNVLQAKQHSSKTGCLSVVAVVLFFVTILFTM